MKIVTHKGTHYPCLIPVGLPIITKKGGETHRSAKFAFTESCMYDLVDEDQHDVNKLFGFSIGHHHKGSSFRFGWRPLLDEGEIEIVAYEYHDGVRQVTKPICRISTTYWHSFDITYDEKTGYVTYKVESIESRYRSHQLMSPISLKKTHGWGYTLGVYFGGNEKAPHKIIINKKKVKNGKRSSKIQRS